MKIDDSCWEAMPIDSFASPVASPGLGGDADAYYRQLFDLCLNEVVVYDPRSRQIVDCNQAAICNLGYTRNELIGRSIESLGCVLTPEALEAGVAKLLDGTQSRMSCLARPESRSGTSYPARLHFHRITGSGATGTLLAIVAQKLDERLNYASLARKQCSLRERERRQLASNLHDSVSQSVMATIIELKSRQEAFSERDRGELIQALENTLEQVRCVTSNLIPEWITEFGLAHGIKAHCERISRIGNIAIKLRVRGNLDAVSSKAKSDCYHIVQESISNVIRHARARQARLFVCANAKGIQIDVRDDGKGFDGGRIGRRASDLPGLGLFGMSDRARLCGGSFKLSSQPGKGTHVRVFLPRTACPPDTVKELTSVAVPVSGRRRAANRAAAYPGI